MLTLIQGQEDAAVYGIPSEQGNTGEREWNREWQTFLGHKGYNIGAACVDGIFGPSTRAATQAFQRDQGIKVAAGGEVLASTLQAAHNLGFSTAPLKSPLSAAERAIACPSAGKSSSPAKSDAKAPVKSRGMLGEVAGKVMTPRGITIGVSVAALLAGGWMLLRDRGQVAGAANWDGGW